MASPLLFKIRAAKNRVREYNEREIQQSWAEEERTISSNKSSEKAVFARIHLDPTKSKNSKVIGSFYGHMIKYNRERSRETRYTKNSNVA